ncbi:MAG: M50 family metallopeptidase [Proteobacteria bacterium]|nr:M50 family metallopeptidase [Pseudomonadota bacterium]
MLVALVVLAGQPAHAEPSDTRLVLTGLALAPPTYVVGVTLHESSHALAALLAGASVDELHLFPPGRDPKAKVFRFGWTYVHGLRSKGDRIFFYLAPKMTDAILLGGFAALAYTDAWPTSHRYGALALTVFATGLWVDFAKDVVLFGKQNDVVKAFDLWCLHGWRQVPARLVYAGLAAVLGFVVAHGYERTFAHPEMPSLAIPPRIAPLFSTTF